MLIKLLFIAALASSAMSRNVARYADLDEEDQELFRAAYDAPYEHPEYQEVEVPGKLELLKGGMWALKAKVKEMKVFDKALAAHLLATKLQVKKMLLTLKNHHVEVEKPVYHYQSPALTYHHYDPPHYVPAPPEHYGQAPQYSPPQHAPPKYDPPAPTQYSPPQHAPPKYDPPAPAQYSPPQHAPPKYDPPAPTQYSPPQYSPPKYEPPAPPQYSPPQHAPPTYDPPAPPQYSPPQHASSKYDPPAPPQYSPQHAPPNYDSKDDPPAPPHYPQMQYEDHQYAAPAQQYGHDPYYGY